MYTTGAVCKHWTKLCYTCWKQLWWYGLSPAVLGKFPTGQCHPDSSSQGQCSPGQFLPLGYFPPKKIHTRTIPPGRLPPPRQILQGQTKLSKLWSFENTSSNNIQPHFNAQNLIIFQWTNKVIWTEGTSISLQCFLSFVSTLGKWITPNAENSRAHFVVSAFNVRNQIFTSKHYILFSFSHTPLLTYETHDLSHVSYHTGKKSCLKLSVFIKKKSFINHRKIV